MVSAIPDALKTPTFFDSTKAKYALIGAIAIVTCFLLYLFGMLFIETLMLVGYAASFPAMMIYEKNRQRAGATSSSRALSEDERWSRAKIRLEKVDDKIKKAKSRAEGQSLLLEKRSLENELRRIEWEIRESDMTQLFNATRGNLKRLSGVTSKDDRHELVSGKEEQQFSEQKFLLSIAKDAESVVHDEPRPSLKAALKPIACDLKAHYNVLKKKKDIESSSNGILSDYWVTWMALSCLIDGVPVDSGLVKYSSEDYRPRFTRFVKSIQTYGG
ncbi:MAG: hypothetical protein ACRDF4_11770 [Rhabdochlamydiaceae bacterium]